MPAGPSRIWFCAFYAHSLLGCGGAEQAATLTPGVYQVSAHTLNATGCEPDGVPVPPEERISHLVVFDDTILDESVSRVFSCLNRTDCSTLRAAVLSSESGPVPVISLTFRDIRSDGQSSLVEQSSGFATEGGLCERPQRAYSTIQITPDGKLSLQTRIYTGANYASNEDGFCTVDAGREATENVDCSSLLTVKALLTN